MDGNNKVALLEELFPGGILGQIAGLEGTLYPIQLGLTTLGVCLVQPQPLGQEGKNLIVRLGLSQGLDALGLQADDPMVDLRGRIRDIAQAAGKLADIPALEIGAGRQDDVGELGLALEPDRLVDGKGELVGPIGLDVAVSLAHGADEGASVAVVHLDRRVAIGRVLVLVELGLDRRAAESLPSPL